MASRPKPPPAGEEEAGQELKLGEFEGVETLSLSEAALVVNALVAKRRVSAPVGYIESEILTKTVDYLHAFSRFKQKENVEAVERLLASHTELSKFERAALGSLCPEGIEEAKTLIPSLADKISDDDLAELLDEMGKLQA